MWLLFLFFFSLSSSSSSCFIFVSFLPLPPFPFSRYMKYLYPYECEKRRLSTPAELQAAIDGNRREGRRSSYGTYAASGSTTNESLVQRNPHTPNSLALHAQMSPLSLVTAVAAGGQHHGSQSLVNGSAAHTPLPHHPHHPQHSQGLPGQPPNAGQFQQPPCVSSLLLSVSSRIAKNSLLLFARESESPPEIEEMERGEGARERTGKREGQGVGLF